MDEPDTAVISVLEAVATVERGTAIDLPPLVDTIDPDALNALLRTDDCSAGPLRVTFDYAGHEVVVERDGRVAVSADPDRGSAVAAEQSSVE